MKVTLIGRTYGLPPTDDGEIWNLDNPELLCAAAARGCYSVKSSADLLREMTPEKMQKTLSHAVEGGHTSVVEHMQFTFSVEGVSRALTHQLVRHRIGTAFSQQSMRYVDVHKLMDHMVTPHTVAERVAEEYAEGDNINDMPLTKALGDYHSALRTLMKVLDANDIPSEDARYYVPMGVMSNITFTLNGREAMHFCGLRSCSRAQDEIRELSDRIAEILKKECPYVFGHLGPNCEQLGYCPEKESCGRKPTLAQLQDGYIAWRSGC